MGQTLVTAGATLLALVVGVLIHVAGVANGTLGTLSVPNVPFGTCPPKNPVRWGKP